MSFVIPFLVIAITGATHELFLGSRRFAQRQARHRTAGFGRNMSVNLKRDDARAANGCFGEAAPRHQTG
jgi:hypothetical protein